MSPSLPLGCTSHHEVSDRKVRVLHVVDTLGMGGAETWLMELLRFWARQPGNAVQVDVLSTSGLTGLFDEEALSLGAKIFYVSSQRSNIVSFVKAFRKILANGHYSAIHDHQGTLAGWHDLMGLGVLPPVRIAHFHNAASQPRDLIFKRRIVSQLGAAMVRQYATHITSTSRKLIGDYGFDAIRCNQIPKAQLHCGFDTARFLGDPAFEKQSVAREFNWPENCKIVLFAGRIDESPDLGHPLNHKNSGFAVDIAIECVRRNPEVRFVFAGAPNEAVRILEGRIKSAGHAGRIRFVGIRRDIGRLMVGSDALLFPSQFEGLGMVAVEAQAAGIPVLASTNVPKECVVVPDLIMFRELNVGASAWVTDLIRLIARPRNIEQANRQVSASPFAIEYSANALARLYADGRLQT